MIQYKVINGSIPQGCRILSTKGVMRIDGVAPLGASFNPPTFSGSSVLPIADEGDVVDIDLEIHPQAGKTLISSTVTRGSLPWGLDLQGNKISGTVAELNVKVPVDFLPEDAPVWSNREGSIGTFNELQNISNIVLSTDKPSSFSIIKGELAWGVVLLPNGTITGKVAELNTDTSPDSAGPGPLFDTARGNLGTFGEGEIVSSNISAIPRTGDNVYLRIIKGGLPWGLDLLPSGSISGKIAELNIGGEWDDPAKNTKPVIPPRTLNAKIGTSFHSVIPVTLAEGRQLLSLRVVSGGMPFGLTLEGNTISGIPVGNTGTFTCQLVAVDSKYVKSEPTTFTFEVTA